jgi:polysaccharide export outer membrane protein
VAFLFTKDRLLKTVLLGLLSFVLLLGCAKLPPKAQADTAKVNATESGKHQEYKIGSNDLLQIDVYQVQELSKEVRVNSNGDISLPLLGAFSVQNLTAHELENVLEKKLGESYLQNPQVNVTIKEYTNQRITVEGLVKNPGVYLFKGDATLLHVLALAQGEDEVANTHQVHLFRDNGKNGKDSYFVDVDAVRKGDVEDPILKGNDILVVQEDTGKSVWKNVKMVINRVVGIGLAIPFL